MTLTTRSTYLFDAKLRDSTLDSPITIYWDSQNKNNPGPAYRDEKTGESGSLEFAGWSDGASGDTGRHLEDYFRGPDGSYLGPDCDGVFPILRA